MPCSAEFPKEFFSNFLNKTWLLTSFSVGRLPSVPISG